MSNHPEGIHTPISVRARVLDDPAAGFKDLKEGLQELLGRASHTSTFQLNLRRLCHSINYHNPFKVLRLSQKVDDCEPMFHWFTPCQVSPVFCPGLTGAARWVGTS